MKFGTLRRHKLSPARLFLCGLVGWAGAALGDPARGWAQESSAAQEAAAAPAAELLGPEELRKLVAPVALYPDDLLAIALPASTNPLQIVQAQRFLDKRNTDQKLQPDAEWDPSILALINYPEVVSKMNADLDWTEDLGNAVIDQQQGVMDMIQQIRAETYAGGYLKSDDKQVVVQEKETIIIQPADPEYIYVPNYDPQVVYVDHGPYYSYPSPVYYATPYPYYWSPAATFFAGAFVGAAFGYGFNWGGGDIDINYGSGCCGGANINTGDINIGNRVDHRTGDRFNADRQRVNGGDKLKWNGNKARQKQGAAARQRASRNTAGTLPAKTKGTGARAKQARTTAGAKRTGDVKSRGNRSTLGNYQSGRDASKMGNQGKRSKQSLQNNRSRQPSGGQFSGQSRTRSNAGAFGGYGGGSSVYRQSNRGGSSMRSSGGRSRGGGGGRRR
jgi:Protein of unknown function (DUF3300)